MIIGGGTFALPLPGEAEPSPPPFLTEEDLLFVNARSAIAHVVRAVDAENVWLPSYLCDALLFGVGLAKPRFYAVGSDFRLVDRAALDEVREGDVVVVIDPFGFPYDEEAGTIARERGAWLLEDASQALLTGRERTRADFTVFSPRKFLGVPDGGILRIHSHSELPAPSLQPPPAEWWLKAFAANVMRRDFDRGHGTRDWFPLGQEVERDAPFGEFAMSELSRALLSSAFDYDEIARRRRENYAHLTDSLGSLAHLGPLPPDVVPIGFPIAVDERDRVRAALFADEIYPMVHWELGGFVPEEFGESHSLSARMLTLPCDQRYGPDDMNRIAARVTEALG